MIRRQMLVTQIKAAESQYETIRGLSGQREARVMLSHRITVLRKQFAEHDAMYGLQSFRQHAQIDRAAAEYRPLVQVAGVVVLVCLITAALLHGCGALLP